MAADNNWSTAGAADPWRVAAALANDLRIAHQIAGRVRLKLAATGDLSALRAASVALRAALAAQPGVRAFQINPLARSCVIEYDNQVIPDAAWPDLLAGRQTDAAAALRDLLVAALPGSFPRSTCQKEKTP